jgi:hypothetical protein
MKKVNFKNISYDKGIELLRNSKTCLVLENIDFSVDYDVKPKEYWNTMHLLDDGKIITMASNWNFDWYGDIDGKNPLWYIGEIVDD